MNTRKKHWIFFTATAIGAIIVVNLAILLMWTDMSEEEQAFGRSIFGRVVTYGTMAMIVLFFISSQFILYIFRNYISPIETLTEETRLITVANAKYRIKPVGAMETNQLTSVINDLADSYISLKSDVKSIVTESKEGFEEEKIRLEVLMNMMSNGIIICNNDGRILMANHQAYDICNGISHNEIGRFSPLGIGRSIFSIFNKAPVTYTFESIQNKIKDNETTKASSFTTTRFKKQYLDIKVAATITSASKNVSGYIFTFNDTTNNPSTSNNFILLDEIASIVKLKTENQFKIIPENGVWINTSQLNIIDLLIEFLLFANNFSLTTLHINLSDDDKLILSWSDSTFTFESKNKFFKEKILNQDNNSLTIKIEAYKQESNNIINDHVEPKPLKYNTYSFNQSNQHNNMDNILLTDLSFVVFDTETTGLDPSNGDEIISIAGIRVVDGQLNNDEIFDELVNPQRSIPLTSLKIHEIYPEMLTDKPTIAKVLPQFYEFVDDAVLVAHNAAFDMRFFQLKEEETKIKFNNPVLDTLLLSAVCHPKQELHNIEDIASKLGVEIIGRHTALGDSIVTAEILLKLIPILNAMGIKTLGEARKAASETELAKIKF